VSAIDALIKLRADLQDLTRGVKRETATSIARQSIRAEALRLGQSWFSEVRPAIEGGAVSDEVLALRRRHSGGLMPSRQPSSDHRQQDEPLKIAKYERQQSGDSWSLDTIRNRRHADHACADPAQ
jgi:hypothetical protein